MLNRVALIGFVAKPPRRVPEGYIFPLAVYRDPHRNPQVSRGREVPDFPPVMVILREGLPAFVRHKALIRVEGFIRTRNRDEPLQEAVRKEALRAGMEHAQVEKLVGQIPRGLVVRRVEVEVLAERLFPEKR